MPTHLRPVSALLLGAAILLMGNGLLGVLLPLRADAEQFTRIDIGIMGSANFAGLVIGCLLWPRVIGRVGHIRAFVALTAMVTVTPLLHAMWPAAPVWWGLRMVTGLCFAGLFMIIESWLNATSAPESRGRVLATYTMINLTVATIGMQLVSLGVPRSFELFSLVAVLYSLAAVPVALASTAAPSPPRQPKLRLGWLFSVSPAAVLGCFFTGLANSSFWTLSPLYARGAGFSNAEVATFLTIAVLAGAASQWPAGRLSDRVGRRRVGIGVSLLASAAGLGLYLAAGGERRSILLLAALYGAMAFPVYTICVAHANDLVHKKRAIEVSSGLLLVFSIGAVMGPLIASTLMNWYGHGAVFLHSAVAHGLIAAVMLLRRIQRPTRPGQRREPFVPVPKTTPAVFELDPRTEDMPAARESGESPEAAAPPRQSGSI